MTYSIPVWLIGVTDSEYMSRRMLTYEEGYNAGAVNYEVKNGILIIEVPAVGSAVLVAVRNNKSLHRICRDEKKILQNIQKPLDFFPLL